MQGLVESEMLVILVLSITVQQAVGQTVCGGFPRPPANSDLKCFATSCMATCRDDHRFENGFRMLALTCRNNTWLPWFGGYNHIPDCLAPCRPTCANGTLCHLPQKQCHCPDGFGGPSCQTAMTCPENEVHRGCADSCNVTCRARAVGEPCKVNCVEGCACRAGMARTDKGQCVALDNCPCYVDGVEIEDGFQSMNTTGERYDVCTCSKQQWTCKPLTKGRAAVFGEAGNLAMFDGTITKYQAYCGFYLIYFPDFDISIDGRPTKFNSGGQNSSDSPSRFRSLNIHSRFGLWVMRLNPNKKVIVDFYHNHYTYTTNLPYEGPGIKIWEASSRYLIAYLSDGIEIHWDGDTVANVFVPPSLYNQTKGILGAYNGKKNNQLVTRNGQYTTSMSTFLDSWRVDSCSLPVMRARENVACSLESIPDNVYQMCSRIFDPIFSECNEMMEYNNIMNYYIACVAEACSCSSDSCACRVVSEYANMCSNMFALNMTSWIQAVPECVPKCPAGQIYQFCRSSCSRSCRSQLINPKCKTECVEGCNCPEGQSLDDYGKCIPTTECFCMHEGKQYKNSSVVFVIINDTDSNQWYSNECTCKNGIWECVRQKSAHCDATGQTGQPVYRTFDDRVFGFKGRCSYTLVQHQQFIIEASNQPSGSGATTANVTIRYEGMKIQLLQRNKVRVDNALVSLPWEMKDVISLYMSTSSVITAELTNKVNITWDGDSTVTIYIPVTFFGSVKGLCGTFNYNRKDDFEMPSGNLATDKVTFGDSWAIDNSCEPIPPLPHYK